ncbi:hypothetical protein AVEN_158022-1, partial [Araneus ventricosus]
NILWWARTVYPDRPIKNGKVGKYSEESFFSNDDSSRCFKSDINCKFTISFHKFIDGKIWIAGSPGKFCKFSRKENEIWWEETGNLAGRNWKFGGKKLEIWWEVKEIWNEMVEEKRNLWEESGNGGKKVEMWWEEWKFGGKKGKFGRRWKFGGRN